MTSSPHRSRDNFPLYRFLGFLFEVWSSDELDAKSIGRYLRKHQIEEGEYIILSKTDMISRSRLEEIIRAIRGLNPTAEVIPYSAITGHGFNQIMELVTSDKKSTGTPVQVDYDIYARTEAELGWYNGQVRFHSSRVDSYDLATKILRGIAENCDPQDIAHIKVMLTSMSNALKMSAVYSNITTDVAKGSRYSEGDVVLTVNARVVSSPEALRSNVRKAIEQAMKELRARQYDFEDDCFSPGRPNPTYRMTGR